MYIMHVYSEFGMGSDSEAWLLDEKQLGEVLRMLRGEKEAMLSRRTTYAGVNDLVDIGEAPVLEEKEDVFENAVFCVWNQWHYPRLVLCGKAVFRRRYLDFRKHEGVGYANGGKIHEFASFSMERVLEFHRWKGIEDTCSMLFFRSERERDILTKDEETRRFLIRMRDRHAAEYEATLRKAGRVMSGPCDILESVVEDGEEFDAKCFREYVLPELRKLDMRCTFYTYPLAVRMIGSEFAHRREKTRYYTHDEVFRKGADARLVPPCLVRSRKTMEEFGGLPVMRIVRQVFGYD